MNARHLAFIVFRRRFPTEACLTCIALPQLPPARAAAATPRTAAATRAAPVAPLLPGTAVALAARIEGFDVLGLEVLIHVSVVVPAEGTRHRRELEASDAEPALHIYGAVRMDARHLAFVVPARRWRGGASRHASEDTASVLGRRLAPEARLAFIALP